MVDPQLESQDNGGEELSSPDDAVTYSSPVPSDSEPTPVAVVDRRPRKKKTQKGAHLARNSRLVMEQYRDLPAKIPRGPGGRPAAPIFSELAVYTSFKDKPEVEPFYRCAGAESGCDKTYGSRALARVLAHAQGCTHLSAKLRQKAAEEQSKDAPGALVTTLSESNASGSKSQPKTSPSPFPTSDFTFTASTSTSAVSSNGRSSSQPSSKGFQPLASPVMATFLKQGRQKKANTLKVSLDHAILRLICVGGIPPSKVDLPEWKDMWQIGNPEYKPVSRSTLEDSQIPKEAAWIKEQMKAVVSEMEDLTLTFDGGTTKALKSIYTVHITTPDRQTFLWVGHEASDRSHTAEHLSEMLFEVCLMFYCE